MKRGSAKTARHIALALALVTPIFLISGSFFIGYVSIDTTLRTEAEVNALFASQIIHSNPDYWRFEQIRFQEFLSRRLNKTHGEIRRIVDLNNTTVAEHRDQVAYPFIMRSYSLYDSGKVVAKLEIIRSLRPLLWKTLLAGFFGYLLTFAIYMWVKIFVLNPRQEAEEALMESERRFRDIAENAAEWVWEVDAMGKYTYSNPVVEQVLGYKPEEVLDKYFYDFFHPDEREELKNAAFKTFAAQRSFQDLLNPNMHKNGQIVWLSTSGVPILDGQGNLLGYRGADIDITALKQAETELRESEQRFRLMAESIEDVFWIAPSDLSKMVYVSPGYELVWGRTCQELYQNPQSFLEAIHPEDQERVMSEIAATQAQNSPWSHEYRIIKPDGTVRWVQDRGFPVRDDQGPGIMFTGIVTDITERKLAEEALKASETRFKAIFEGAAIGIGLLDLEGRILKVNPAAQELLGYEVQEQVGKYLSEILHPEDNSSTLTLYQELGAENIDQYRVANRFLTKDGRLLWLDFTVSLIRGVKGEPLFAIAMGQDITEQQEAAERISSYHRRLQGLAAQLEEVQEAERRLLTRELHDRVGQNLGVLGINLNLLQSLVQEGDNNQIQVRLADSVAVVEQTVALIRDLMAELRPPELDDYGLLEALRSDGAKFSRRTNIAVDVAGEELTPRLAPSVEISLFRIVQEALTNVAKHAQATRVRVTKIVDEGKVCLTIADNGAGFDRTSQENIKERQGWGLITMTERAVAVGGHCRIESRPGEGTRVIVEVPR